MDPFEVLGEDHRRLLELGNELTGGAGEPTGTPGERRRVARRLVVEGSKHEAIEEQHLWPVVRGRLGPGQALADRGLGEERRAKKLLHQLDRMSAGNVHFKTISFMVVSTIRDHVAFEEGQVWPKLRLALNDRELDEIGEKLASARRLAPTRPHPLLPPNDLVLATVGPLAAATDRLRDLVTGRGR